MLGATAPTLWLEATDAQALALPERVEAQADVAPDRATAVVFDRTGLVTQVAVEELAKRPFADEADAGGVFFLRVGQVDLGREVAHLGLLQLAHREQRARQLLLIQAVQEVALVLAAVDALEQLESASPLAHPSVVAGGDALGTQPERVVEKRLELDLGVAQHVGIRRAAGLVFAQELGEHAVLVLGREVDMLEFDADHVGHGSGIDEIDVGTAILVVVVIFPVLHEDADHFVTLALEQPGRDRGVDPAGQADHHTRRTHAAILGLPRAPPGAQGYTDACVPSQNGWCWLCLQPQKYTVAVSVAVYLIGV